MITEKYIEQMYALHSRHKKDNRERKYLGTAESAQEILDIATEMRPESYAVLASCMDGSALLRLINDEKTWKIGLKRFTRQEILELLGSIEQLGVPFKEACALTLDRETLREPFDSKVFRKIIRPLLDLILKIKLAAGSVDKNLSSSVRF